MGRYLSGTLKSEIHFRDIYVEDGESVLDVLFPEGWEGEMVSNEVEITEECED